jgi:hypothetical protein
MSPAMVGQFPAAALLYRRGLVSPGRVLAQVHLNRKDLLALSGTPLPQDAALDELRLKDIPSRADPTPGTRLDPLVHYAGRAEVKFTTSPSSVRQEDLRPLIDHTAKTVASSTGELKLDYGKGFLVLNAPAAQGISGSLQAAGSVQTKDLTLSSDLELGHIVAVSLDEQPLAVSGRILLQAMSEEKTSEFKTEAVSPTVKRITSIGHDPWLVKELNGRITFRRADAASLKVAALDFNGYPLGSCGTAQEIVLQPATIYYLISR